MHARLELYLAWRYLRFNSGQAFLSVITLISVAGVIVGTVAVVIALSLNAGFVRDVRERIHSGAAHLTVLRPDAEPFEGWQTMIRRTAGVEGVEAAGPVLFAPAMLVVPRVAEPEFAEVVGIDAAVHQNVVSESGWDESPFPAIDRETESGRQAILVGRSLAGRLGAYETSQVQVVVAETTLSPWGPVPRQAVFELVDVYRSDQFEQDSRRAYVDLRPLQRLLRVGDRVSWIEVRVDDLDRLDDVKRRLAAELGDEWRVVDLLETNAEFLQALNLEKLLLFLSFGLIVAVASLNIASTLILSVNDKIKEIGALSAMGASPVTIALIFVVQGFVVGLVGVVVGLPLGAGISRLLDGLKLIKLNPEVYYLTHVPFHVQPIDLAAVGLVTLVIALLATIYPALKAARLDPVEALRYE